MSLLDEIRLRGHWRSVIRPAPFSPNRVPYHELEPLIRDRQVRLRGWFLPHISNDDDIERGPDWVGQESRYDYHLELWRFWTSGQFAIVRAMAHDWRDVSSLHPATPGSDVGRVLPVWAVLNMTTELFELAARLALSAAGGDVMVVRLVAAGLEGRFLVVDDPGRAEFTVPMRASVAELVFEKTYEREDLVALSRDHALDASTFLFERFGWDGTSRELLGDLQRKLLGDR